MLALLIIRDYVMWHYSRAYLDIFAIWRNVAQFVYHFFSIPLLIRSLFQPWKRIMAKRESSGFDLKDWLETTVVNFIMRIVGALFRTVLIIIGLLCVAAAVVLGIQFLILWTFLPFVLVMLLPAGITLIFFV